MINEYTIKGDVVEMVVYDKTILFDTGDFQKLDRFNQWKLSRGKSVVADYRMGSKMQRITLHRLITGSKFVKWLNGNIFDFRKENITPIEKSIRPRPCGVTLKGNQYRINQDTVIIDITCKGKPYEAYLDYNDYQLISNYTWYVNPSTGYVQTKARLGRSVNKGLYMHRLIMGVSGHKTYVDHINGNRMDNRRSNLRVCSPSQNGHNKHVSNRVVGVSRVVTAYWEARIQVNKVPFMKRFKTYEEALEQRRQWEKEFNPSGLRNADT